MDTTIIFAATINSVPTVIRSQDEVVTVSRLKACTAAVATPGSPPRHGRPPGSRPGSPAATKLVSFSYQLVSSPSSAPAPPRYGPRTVFLPGEEVFACPGPAVPSQPPQMQYPSCHQATPKRLDLWPLLLPAEARARGSPVESWLHPRWPLNQLGVLHHLCTVPVYKLLFIRL